MKELKERVLELIDESKKNSLDRKMIASKLGLTRSFDFIKLEKLMDEMEENLELFRGSRNTYMNRRQANVVLGKLNVNRKGIGYIDRKDDVSIMIMPEHLRDAMDGDMVLVKPRTKIDSRTLEFETTGTIIRVVEHAHQYVTGTFVTAKAAPRFVPNDQKLKDVSISVRLPKGFRPVEGMVAVMKIERYDQPLELHLDHVLGYVDDPGVDIAAVLAEHEILPDFPEAVVRQVADIPAEVQEEELEGRRDLTKEITVTIDGDHSKDFDDAVSVTALEDGWNLKVSIADVSHYVTEDSPLDKEAFQRGTSTYAINTVVPMIPHELSNGICSLNPHVIRLTNTCDMKIRRDGTVESYELYPSYIRSTARLTYNKVNKMLDGDKALIDEYLYLGSLVEDLRDCADAIRSQRVEKGAIDFDTEESEIIVDETGKPVEIRLAERGHAERMIEDCMIAANVSVANFMKRNNYPAVYRVHDEPQARKLRNFASLSYMLGHEFNDRYGTSPKEVQRYLDSVRGTDEYDVLAAQMLRCMTKAVYDSNCAGHFGLAEEEYLHFTSPIRRYPDLIVHRMLRKYAYEHVSKDLIKDQSRMTEYAEQSSVRERNAQNAEYDCEDMKKAEYMMNHIGDIEEGIITSVTSFGFYVQLANTVEGLVRVDSLNDDYYRYDEGRMSLTGERRRHVYRIGQIVKVKVVGASKDAKTVDFTVMKSDERRGYSDRAGRTTRHGKKEDRAPRGGRKAGDRRSFDEHKRFDKPEERSDDRRRGDKHSVKKEGRKTAGWGEYAEQKRSVKPTERRRNSAEGERKSFKSKGKARSTGKAGTGRRNRDAGKK